MDLWIMRDTFLQDTFPTLQTMKTNPNPGRNIPYIYEQYNDFFFFIASSSQQHNFLARVQNAIAEAFNRRNHLPRYILMILYKDLIEAVNFYDYRESTVLRSTCNWLAKQLEHSIDACLEELTSKKPGAAYGNSKIIWIKMIPRKGMQEISNLDRKILAAKPKFNSALNLVSERRRNTHVMSIISLEEQHYDKFSQLTYGGKTQYWKEVDYLIKKFDRKEITLTACEELSNR